MRAVPATLLALALLGCKGEAPAGIDQAELARRWTRVSRCLIGNDALGEDETASRRMYESELTLLAQGEEQTWPGSCTKLIDEALELLDAPGGEAYGELRTALRHLSGTQPDMYLSGEPKQVDELFAAAEKAGLKGDGDAGDAPTAPKPASPARAADLALLGRSRGLIERTELAPSDKAVRFALGDADGLLCVLGGDPPLSRARCSAVAGPKSGLFRPLSAENPDLLASWDFQPKPAVELVGGERYEMTSSASAFVFENGVIADVLGDGFRPELVRRLESGRVDRAPLRAPPGARFLGFRAGGVIWRGAKRGHGVSPLIVQSVQSGRVPMTMELENGEMPPTVEHLIACRHGERLTIAMAAEKPVSGDEVPIALVTRIGTRWSKPITASLPLAGSFKKDESWWRDLSCRPDGADLSFIRDDGRVGLLRCGEEACESALSEPVPLAGRLTSQRITALGDKVLLVRSVSHMAPMTGITDTVVMRLGTIAEIAQGHDRVLVGDEKHGGLPGIAKGVGLVGTDTAAVVILRSNDQIYGLRIDASGAFSSLATH